MERSSSRRGGVDSPGGSSLPRGDSMRPDAMENPETRCIECGGSVHSLNEDEVGEPCVACAERLLETLPGIRAARRIVEAVRAEDGTIPLLSTFSLTEDGRLPEGGDVGDIARFAADFEVDLVGLNCSFGPAPMDEPLSALRSAWRGPLGAWPNAGVPSREGKGWVWPVDTESMAAWCTSAARSQHLQIVGGCCGTTTEHVAAIATALAQSGGSTPP